MKTPTLDSWENLFELSNAQMHRTILEGLADAQAGRRLAHEEIVAWAPSLRCQASRAQETEGRRRSGDLAPSSG